MIVQQEFAVDYGSRDVGNRDVELSSMVKRLKDGRLQIPSFQREPCWLKKKVTEWCESVISRQAIGVIVTYQIQGNGPEYLADGLQRLTATSFFMENPQGYGFSFGPEMAERYCDAFEISVQHRHYESHAEAMVAFQNLNKGTTTTPAEYHKGEMTLGNAASEYVYGKVSDIVANVENSLNLDKKKKSRAALSRLLRDSLVLFHQYMTYDTSMTFCRVGKVQEEGKAIENKLAGLILEQHWTLHDAEKNLASFERFLSTACAEIKEILIETEQTKKVISLTLVRSLFHLAIWRKNARQPVDMHRSFLTHLFESLKDYANLPSRLEIPGVLPKRIMQLGLNSLSHLRMLDRHFETGLFDIKKRPPAQVPSGYDQSHILPFSEHGDGLTVVEPSSWNRARGAMPIDG